MAHPQQVEFCLSVKQKHPSFFSNQFVLDIGSLDINGNNQYLFDDCLYLGIDLAIGRNVDLATKGHELSLPSESVDVIVSTECFEHDQFYERTIQNIVRMLKPGGLFVFSCATTGRPEHGTRRTTPADAPFLQTDMEWGDYYKNLEADDIKAVLDVDGLFEQYAFSTNMQTFDLYFWGIKKGVKTERRDYSFQVAKSKHELHIAEINQRLHEKESHLAELNQRLNEKESHLTELNLRLNERQADIQQLHAQMKLLLSSHSWLITKPLRFLARMLRSEFSTAAEPLQHGVHRVTRVSSKARNAARYIGRGDFKGLMVRARAHRKESVFSHALLSVRDFSKTSWGIMATPHTLFMAHMVAERLRINGWHVEIMTEAPSVFRLDWYIVICPQMFNKLPPGEKRIAFQMEQSVSSRWFTTSYLKTLESSLAVLEYSLVNIEFLETKGIVYPHINYLPVGAQTNYGQNIPITDKPYDVLFYGDCHSSPRRREMLAALKQHFNVHIASEVFGDAMITLIKQSKLVINLHYYENALLEMPRIQECLSLGAMVISESAQDQNDYPELTGGVRFFEQGSIPGMLAAVTDALQNPISSDAIAASVAQSSKRFAFNFDRFLVSMGYLTADHARNLDLPLPAEANQVALSLPETIHRRRIFEREQPSSCVIFDGIRRHPGWVGCGLSYLTLAKHALAHGHDQFTIMEDDVLLPTDIEEKLVIVQEYLAEHAGEWDVFAGIIACLHDEAKVVSVEVFKGITFVTVNKMTSMVFNIYSKKALQLLADWDPSNQDAETNTIDRYIESQTDLRVVVALPFLFGHREEVHSTLWGFQNTQYLDLIQQSEQALTQKVLAFQQ